MFWRSDMIWKIHWALWFDIFHVMTIPNALAMNGFGMIDLRGQPDKNKCFQLCTRRVYFFGNSHWFLRSIPLNIQLCPAHLLFFWIQMRKFQYKMLETTKFWMIKIKWIFLIDYSLRVSSDFRRIGFTIPSSSCWCILVLIDSPNTNSHWVVSSEYTTHAC